MIFFNSSRKLHGIQNSLMINSSSVFYIPNLERCDRKASNIIGTEDFLSHQYELNVIWHIIEGQPAVSRSIDVELKNMKHFLEASAIDFNSSIQLTFDVLSQLLDVSFLAIYFLYFQWSNIYEFFLCKRSIVFKFCHTLSNFPSFVKIAINSIGLKTRWSSWMKRYQLRMRSLIR